MHELYITNDYEAVYKIAQQKAKDLNLDLYVFEGIKVSLDTLVELHKEHIKAVVLIKNITKAPIFDILLSILEETDLHIILISPKNDIKQALISRCEVKVLKNNYTEEIIAFINKKTLPKELTIDFLVALSDYMLDNKSTDINLYSKLCVIDEIIKDIRLSTNNILQDELKDRLRAIL